MASAKSVFERSPVAATASPPMSKKPSKWDKPKSTPPPPVNREGEDPEADSELPPPSYTKSMLAKFQTIGQNDGQQNENIAVCNVVFVNLN